MSKNEVYLGIDTSCYTTSVALIGREGGLVGEARRILQVKPGCRGLQQSEMVFQHTRNLPILLEEVLKKPLKVIGIGVSARPRPLEDSYMPAFFGWVGPGALFSGCKRNSVMADQPSGKSFGSRIVVSAGA